jgi:hypothetical protein
LSKVKEKEKRMENSEEEDFVEENEYFLGKKSRKGCSYRLWKKKDLPPPKSTFYDHLKKQRQVLGSTNATQQHQTSETTNSLNGSFELQENPLETSTNNSLDVSMIQSTETSLVDEDFVPVGSVPSEEEKKLSKTMYSGPVESDFDFDWSKIKEGKKYLVIFLLESTIRNFLIVAVSMIMLFSTTYLQLR